MINKQERTVETYKQAGAAMRLTKSLINQLVVDISPVLLAKDQDRLLKAMNMIDEVSSHAEDNMFKDHPQLNNHYIDVFYGDVADEPRNEVDKKIIEIAKEVSDGLFKRKGN